MSESLKHKTGLALFWSFIDKGGYQLIQLIFWFILMKLLTPDEFGQFGVLAVFTVIATILQESGFFSALVRKKDVDEKDYSSVFYFNITVSFILYFILFFSAPFILEYFISEHFKYPELTAVSRFLFLAFVLNAFGVVQNVHLTRRLDFKTNAKISFASSLLSGIVAVIAAFNGCGIWSLAIQVVLQGFIRVVLLWIFVRWYPTTGFFLERIRQMFSYSSSLLINSLFYQLSSRIYTWIIGKNFSMSDVGYYEQASKLNNIPQSLIGGSLQTVGFSVLSKLDTEEKVKSIFRKFLRISVFVSFPVAMQTIVSAESIVGIISERWEPIIPYLQLLAIGWGVYPSLYLINALLQAIGKASLLLKIEVAKSILYLLALPITLQFGVMGLIVGYSAVNLVTFIYGFYFAGRCISFSMTEVVKDILPYLVLSLVVFTPLLLLNSLTVSPFLLLTIQVIIGWGVYLLLIKLLGSKVLDDFVEFIKMKRGK